MYLEDSCKQLESFEGSVPWMYLDTRGNVTVGVGMMLPNLAAAQTLPFQSEGQPASSIDIANSWARTKFIGPGRLPRAYHYQDAVTLTDDVIEANLRTVVSALDAGMQHLYPAYSTWPDPAKIAVIDMAYNLGTGGLAAYHHMNASLNLTPPDFATAANQCSRDGIPSTRNAWCKNQFILAQS